MKPLKSQRGVIPIIEVILIVALIGVASATVYYQNRNAKYGINPPPFFSFHKKKAAAPAPAPAAVDPYAGWKTYTSASAKLSFKYPTDWKSVTPALQGNGTGHDELTIASPSGDIKVNWISQISGFGGACDPDIPVGTTGPQGITACSQVTVQDKTAIGGAPGLFVVSGIITSDGTNFQPWIAVQNDTGLVKDMRTMGYDMFNSNLFSTGSVYASGPKLSQVDAKAWFNKTEPKLVKLMMLSLTAK